MSNNFNLPISRFNNTNFNFYPLDASSNDFSFTDSGYTPPVGSFEFQFGEAVPTYYILKGTSNNFTSIWADVGANYNSGRFYVASNNTFNVVDASVPKIYDYYTQTYGGRFQETLESNDIVDINVGG